jgi:hypothetical protein
MPWILPVDLAEAADFTAVGAVDVTADPPRRYAVRHLDRWRAKYPETVERVSRLANTPALMGAAVVVDATGVGRPVVQMIRAALPGRAVYGITITAGSNVTAGAGPLDVRVPKKDLVGAAQVLFQTGRLMVARELPLADTLIQELANFKVRITPALNETYEAWRDGDHDDLVLALAMAAWFGENLPGPVPDPSTLVLNRLASEDSAADRPKTRMEMLADEFPALVAD